MYKLIKDSISASNANKLITLNNDVCYEWELIPIEKALLLTYNLLKRIENSHHWSVQM